MSPSVRKWFNTQEKNTVAPVKDLLLTLECRKILVSIPVCVLTFRILQIGLGTVSLKKEIFSKN